MAVKSGSKDIIELLIDYANEYQIVLKFNEKNDQTDYPLLSAIRLNRPDIVKMLIDYCNKKNISDQNSKRRYMLL